MADETPATPPAPAPVESLTDRQLLERNTRALEHVDLLVHELHNLAARAAPLLDRVSGLGSVFGKGARRDKPAARR